MTAGAPFRKESTSTETPEVSKTFQCRCGKECLHAWHARLLCERHASPSECAAYNEQNLQKVVAQNMHTLRRKAGKSMLAASLCSIAALQGWRRIGTAIPVARHPRCSDAIVVRLQRRAGWPGVQSGKHSGTRCAAQVDEFFPMSARSFASPVLLCAELAPHMLHIWECCQSSLNSI
jgi:hypothetical protein